MNFKKMKNKLIAKFSSLIKKVNHVNIDEGYRIHESVKLKGVNLSGKVTIQEGSKILNGAHISAQSPVTIGRYTTLNGPGTDISAHINEVSIGSFCSIARGTTIQESNHQFQRLSSYFIFKNIFHEDPVHDIESKGPITIGHDVWVGANVTILPGVNIGHGAVVAANSVVTKDVSAYTIVGGNPAKPIKMRFDEAIIDRLLKIKWWDWKLEQIKANRELFKRPLSIEKLDKIQY